MRYPLIARSSRSPSSNPQRAEGVTGGDVAIVSTCYHRRFGRPPVPGTVEPIADLPLAPEIKAQLVHDIIALVHLAVDPLIESRVGLDREVSDQFIAQKAVSDYDTPE